MEPYLDHARAQLRFGDVDASDINDGTIHDSKGRRPPLDTRAKEDRPPIVAALSFDNRREGRLVLEPREEDSI